MSTAPDLTEARLRAALAAVAPVDTRVDDGLADLQVRLRGDHVVALRRPARRWMAAAAAVVVLLLGLGAAVVLGGGDDGGGGRGSPAPTTTPAGSGEAARLQFRPVLAVDTCDALLAPAPDARPDRTGVTCYELGPVAVDGTDLQDAEAAVQETWVVDVEAKPDSVDRFNALFNACYDGDPTCPAETTGLRGQVAVVLDGTVISAPAVNGPDLADDRFTLSADFDQAAAEDLAAMIDAG